MITFKPIENLKKPITEYRPHAIYASCSKFHQNSVSMQHVAPILNAHSNLLPHLKFFLASTEGCSKGTFEKRKINT